MSDTFDYLTQGLDRILASDPQLAEEIRDQHGAIRGKSADTEGPEAYSRSRTTGKLSQGELETIVKKKGRPVLAIRHNEFKFDVTDVDSEVWKSRLKDAREAILGQIPAVGRVELRNHPDYSWVGTAWMVHDEIAVTNRHVASVFAKQKGREFVLRTEPGFPAMESSVDFLQEADLDATREFKVVKVLYIEPESGPDLAFLQLVRERGSDKLSRPIKLASKMPNAGQLIAAIGYPARDSRVPDQAAVLRIFGEIYDKKRLAPGIVRNSNAEILTHDASTLGGNSGSVLIDLKSGEAVGLHRAGLYLKDNFAVPAKVVRDRLDKVRAGIFPITADMSQPKRTAGSQANPAKPDPMPPKIDAHSVTWTIPLHVTVSLGQAGGVSVSSAGVHVSPGLARREEKESVEAAMEKVRELFSGREGVVNIRSGYQYRDGWITRDRAVIVATTSEVTGIPDQVFGVPVEVVAASPWDLLEVVPQAEGLERVPETHYEPPQDIELEEVDETMRIICHVSPDAGWPTLKKFLGEPTSRLTVGMYDFTAPHIISAVKKATKDEPAKLNLVIQHGAALEGEAKEDDIPDEKVVAKFERLLGDRLSQAWASVSGPGRLFGSSYHIKVAVRNGRAFWLSSGNWQSSNQPDIDPIADNEKTLGPLRSFNREWHAIVENKSLARQFEKFLLWDLKEASRIAEEAPAAEELMVLVPEEALADEGPEAEVAARAEYFAPLDVTRRIRVMPLLTPDNFQPEILKLIRGAKKQILFQNQSLNLLDDNDPGFEALMIALRDQQKKLEDVRIIIRGDFSPRAVLDKLQDFGFDMDRIRAQKKCHTKGIIVDSQRVALGSHNWTNQGTLVNRDASLIIHDEEIAKYYRRIFEFDWNHRAKAQVSDELPPVKFVGASDETPEGMRKVSLRDLLLGDG